MTFVSQFSEITYEITILRALFETGLPLVRGFLQYVEILLDFVLAMILSLYISGGVFVCSLLCCVTAPNHTVSVNNMCDEVASLTAGPEPRILADQLSGHPHTKPVLCTKRIHAVSASQISLCFSRLNGSSCEITSTGAETHIYMSDPSVFTRLPGIRLCKYTTFPSFTFQTNQLFIRTNFTAVPSKSTWEMEYSAGESEWSCWNQWTSGTCRPAEPDGILVGVSYRERMCLTPPCSGESVETRARTCTKFPKTTAVTTVSPVNTVSKSTTNPTTPSIATTNGLWFELPLTTLCVIASVFT